MYIGKTYHPGALFQTSSLLVELDSIYLVIPAINCDNLYEIPTKDRLSLHRDSVLKLYIRSWSWKYLLPNTYKKFQFLRRTASVHHNPHCLYSN